MKKLVVLSGAGISAESGIKTFRESGGLWENYDIMEVASPQGWAKNPEMVLDFYNQRRQQIISTQPNEAHYILKDLEKYFVVNIITQNIDDLHERAGSTKITHLHGEILKSRSTKNDNLIFDISGSNLALGDLCPLGSQLRPHIVWFGEEVPKMAEAIEIVSTADILLIIGTSMQVYPAASLIDFKPNHCITYIIDLEKPPVIENSKIVFIRDSASSGLNQLLHVLTIKSES